MFFKIFLSAIFKKKIAIFSSILNLFEFFLSFFPAPGSYGPFQRFDDKLLHSFQK